VPHAKFSHDHPGPWVDVQRTLAYPFECSKKMVLNRSSKPASISMSIHTATQQYERWLGHQISLVRADLRLKHTVMKHDAFSFLRATFYRWMQEWPLVCTSEAQAPVVLAVGDLHVDNFGTWRDLEGRLIWGINDFDEAYPLPYTNDLVRVAVSAKLAINADHLTIKPKDAFDAILTGYREGLKAEGRPIVLDEHHRWLLEIATSKLRDPVRFWRTIHALPPVKGSISASARAALDRLMPEPKVSYSLRRRVSGMGSLGRPRYVALAEWYGGKIAREAKVLVPSACLWAKDGHGLHTIMYQSLVDQAVRSRDPFVQVQNTWLVRRLAPYCSRIALTALPKKRDENRLLYAMGWETANVHLGSWNTMKAVRRDLSMRKGNWLRIATEAMARATISDWKEWANR
jgi:Uncharacterized protein conserved in bacteria (DUF2252)